MTTLPPPPSHNLSSCSLPSLSPGGRSRADRQEGLSDHLAVVGQGGVQDPAQETGGDQGVVSGPEGEIVRERK